MISPFTTIMPIALAALLQADVCKAPCEEAVRSPSDFAPAAVQVRLPTSGISVAVGSEISWQTVNNIVQIGSHSALIFPLSAGQFTGFLAGQGYGFSIPSGATILGVEVEMHWYDSNFNGGDHAKQDQIRLWHNGSPIGNNKSTYADIPICGCFTTFGGPTDLWGATLTPAIVNSSTFGAAFKAYHVDTGLTGSSIDIDAIRIRVYYQ